MPDQFTVQWAVRYTHYGQERTKFRNNDDNALLTEEQARKWAAEQNRSEADSNIRVMSRRVTEWTEANLPEEDS